MGYVSSPSKFLFFNFLGDGLGPISILYILIV
nr:MAG TPA: hypothetical protein [Caudoviricetes sp.]